MAKPQSSLREPLLTAGLPERTLRSRGPNRKLPYSKLPCNHTPARGKTYQIKTRVRRVGEKNNLTEPEELVAKLTRKEEVKQEKGGSLLITSTSLGGSPSFPYSTP